MKTDGRVLIATAGIFYGTLTVGGSLLSKQGLSALDVSFFFLFFSLFPLSVLVAAKDRSFFGRAVSSWKYLGLYALINTFLVIPQFASLALGLSPAITALLLYTQPVWTIIFGRLLFKDKIDASRIEIIILALTGVLLITNPNAASIQGIENLSFSLANKTIVAEFLALSGGVFLALWIILGKKGRLAAFKDPIELTLAVRGSTFVPIAIICFSMFFIDRSLFLANTRALSANLLWLFVFSIVAGVLPDFLFYAGIDRVKPLQAGVLLLLEPVSSAIISASLLLVGLKAIQVIGAILILLSNYLVIRPHSSQRLREPEGQNGASETIDSA